MLHTRRARFFGLGSLAVLLAACGGDDEPALNATASASIANSPPRITGTPPTSVLQSNAYSFAPSITDSDGDSLAFSIVNRPAWATFDATTGRLSGTPAAADVGTYGNITITVNDGSATTSLGPFRIDVAAVATGSVTLSWLPPTQNTDGSPLSNLGGYRIHWGTAQGSYTNSATISNAGLSSYVVDQLTPATWFFVVSAVTTSGIESSFSNVASKRIQ